VSLFIDGLVVEFFKINRFRKSISEEKSSDFIKIFCEELMVKSKIDFLSRISNQIDFPNILIIFIYDQSLFWIRFSINEWRVVRPGPSKNVCNYIIKISDQCLSYIRI